MASNSFKVKNSLVLTPKDLSTLTSPEAGDLACDINDNNKIKRYDANAAAWVEVGSGGVGGVDIFFVQDFESASLSSFTQTGLVLSQTDPLKGKVSAVLNHQAAINQSFKQIIPVDRKFRGQSMVLRLDSKSDASQGNLVINIYDETNSANLVSSEQLQLSNDVNGRKTSVSFTIPETCASLSYTITALPESGKVSRIDDIICELSESALLETSVVTPNVTAWQGYTPTFQGFGTPSNIEFEWRQVGENVEIRGKFTAGTTTAVEARVGLPGGLTSAGTSLIPSIQLAGIAARGSSASASYYTLIEPNVTYLTFSREDTGSAITKLTGSAYVSSGDQVILKASVPCAGLSATTTKTIPLTQSGLVQNPDSMVRLSTPNGRGSTNTAIYRFSTIEQNLGTDIIYQDSATNGASFTIVTSGVYSINFTANNIISTDSIVIGISKNSSQLSTSLQSINSSDRLSMGFSRLSANTSQTKGATASWTGYLTAGDIIRPHGDLSNLNQTEFTISRQSSLKQVSVSSDQKITIPTSELRMEGASTRGSTATAIVRFDTTAKLRGDAFTVESDSVLGTRITMKKAGKLDVNTTIFRSGSTNNIYISKNQLILTGLPSQSETMSGTFHSGTNDQECVSWSGFVSINDVIRISTSQTPTADIRNNLNLAFQEQDISVSVTNTLPQFSESDSSVRVDTANGYGSTGTKIRRFSNVRDNIGTDIEYADSATNGASFTIRSAGIYHISYTESFTAAAQMGITKNQSSLTTDVQLLSASEILATSTSTSNSYEENVAWSGYLNVGDIIRAATNAGVAADASNISFTISKVGKPNVTGVNVTPFVNVPQSETETAYLQSASTFTNATVTGVITSFTNKGILSYNSSTGVFTALKRCNISASFSGVFAAGTAVYTYIRRNGAIVAQNASINGGRPVSTSYEGTLEVGETLTFTTVDGLNDIRISLTATALSDQILTAPETFSTDTAALTYASSAQYTMSTLANAPIGTYITYTCAINTTDTFTQTTTRPTQTDAGMNTNGIQLFARAYGAASTAAQPAVVAIQIGKGWRGVDIKGYTATEKGGNSISLDAIVRGSTNIFLGLMQKEYNPTTGILVLDAASVYDSTNTTHVFYTTSTGGNSSSATNGYFVINASKSPALTGVPLVQPRIATLSDVKASGTAGGTATSGVFVTRTLNTIDDPTGIVTSLASNQFTLPAGEYYIEASTPVYSESSSINLHKVKLFNRTDLVDAIIGTSERLLANSTSNSSRLSGKITINSPKAFEIQHRVTTALSVNDFGIASSFGVNEVYTIVRITKIK